MIGRIFWSIIAILFPWIILLLDDNPGGALIAFLMQATFIGWLPASIWAYRVANPPQPKKSTSKPISKSEPKP